MDKDNMNDNSYESTDKYCLVIIEKGLPVFVSMAMPKHSCETMKVAVGEGEIVPSDLGLSYKRMMTNIPDLLQNSEVRQPTGVRTALSHSASIPLRERGCLVVCQIGGLYWVATRQLMTFTQAEEYIKGISSDRYPVIVHPNVDWDLRPPNCAVRQPKVQL